VFPHTLWVYSVAFITFVILFYKCEGVMTEKAKYEMNLHEWLDSLHKMGLMDLSAILG